MNFPDEDGVEDIFNSINYDAFGIDDHHSPLEHDHSLQIPMREPSPASPSRDLEDSLYGFGDPSLTIPLPEFSQSESSRLSPPLLPYHQHNQNYGQSTEMQMEVPYNSFEQPSAVVNVEYSLSAQIDSPINLSDNRGYYQEQPSTSQQPPPMQQHQHQQQHQQQQHITSQPQQRQMQNTQSRNVQRIISTPGPAVVTPQPRSTGNQQTKYQAPRRTVQSRTNGKKKVSSGSVGEVLNTAHKMNAGNGGQPSAVRLSPEQMQQLAFSAGEISRLENEQNLGVADNTERIKELKQQQAQIFLEALASQSNSVTGEVINQLHQIKQQPVSRPPPRQHRQQMHMPMDATPDSPQYEPQIYLSHTNVSQTQIHSSYNDYNMMPPAPVQHVPQQRPVYRVTSGVQVSYQSTQSQQAYVQPLQPTYTQPGGPTVGQIIKQQHMRSTPAKGSARQVLVQSVVTPQPAIVHPPPPPPQPITVIRHPPRPTPEQTMQAMEERKIMRLNRLKDALDVQQQAIIQPRTEEKFNDMLDVLMRLLPYHQGSEPDVKEEELEQFDCNYLRKMINLSDSKKRIERKMRTVLFNEAMRSAEKEEENLLLFLDMEYEKRKLEGEKKLLQSDPSSLDSFVQSSVIIPALRDTTLPSLEKKFYPPLKLHFDYHPFCDIPSVSSPAKSPIKSPSSVKSSASSIRDPSPVKSPVASTSRTVFKTCVLSGTDFPDVPAKPSSIRPKHTNEQRLNHISDRIIPQPKVEHVAVKNRISHISPAKREPAIVLKNSFTANIPTIKIKTKGFVNNNDSDGSCSPELGVDDIVQPSPSFATNNQDTLRSKIEHKDNKPVAPEPTSEKKKENNFTVLARVDNRQNPENEPRKDLNIKIPRFKPMEPKPKVREVEKPKEPTIHIIPPALPPIKLKFSRAILDARESPVLDKSSDKNSKKKKKKKKRKRDSHDFSDVDEQKKPKKISPTPEFVFVRTEGLRVKFIRGQISRPSSISRETTPAVTPAPPPAPVQPTPPITPQSQPIKLKIRLGPRPNASASASASSTPAARPKSPVSKNGPIRLSSVGVPAASKLPSIDFSDDSDSEADKLRSSTDEALRGCGLSRLSGLTSVPKRPLLPWSSQP